MVCTEGEIEITVFGVVAEKKAHQKEKKFMRTVVFTQGFNRVEHHQIICLERAKLNRLLDEERRFTETLIESAKREIEARPQILPNFETIWNTVQNHEFVRNIRRRIDCLTDAYPQFLRQVETARSRLLKKVIAAVEAARYTTNRMISTNNFTSSAVAS